MNCTLTSSKQIVDFDIITWYLLVDAIYVYRFNISYILCSYIPFNCCTYDFQKCGILTVVDIEEPVQPPLKLRNYK